MEKRYIVKATAMTGKYGRQMKQSEIHPEGYFNDIPVALRDSAIEVYDPNKVYEFSAPVVEAEVPVPVPAAATEVPVPVVEAEVPAPAAEAEVPAPVVEAEVPAPAADETPKKAKTK